MKLTWGLAIATCDRRDILCRCVEAALRQTRSPAEIVICDASEDWFKSRQHIGRLIEKISSNVRLWYGPSIRAQQTVQRNIAIHHSTADVLFMIDDDSILRRDAAHQVMRIYENRLFRKRVVAVGVGAAADESDLQSSDDTAEMFRHHRGFVRRLGAKIFGSYFFAFPVRSQHPLRLEPSTRIKDTTYIEGFQMTVRSGVAARCGFDENLVSGHFEDLDATIRFSRVGAVVMLDRPLLFHAKASRPAAEKRRGMLSRFGWVLNISYLNRKYFGDSLYVRLFCWTHWLRCFVLDLVLAPARRDLSRVRACMRVVPAMIEMTFAPQSEIKDVVIERIEALKIDLRAAGLLRQTPLKAAA